MFNFSGSILVSLSVVLVISCSIQKGITRVAKKEVILDSVLASAHVGISVFDAVGKKFLFNYQGDKYFVPASNVKIFTCYAAMKYLKDSIAGLRYFENDTAIFLIPTGDPTLLHADFSTHPVIDHVRKTRKQLYITELNWNDKALGPGWSWGDYNQEYMAERSPMPLYGNVIRWIQERTDDGKKDTFEFDQSVSIYSLPEVDWKVNFTADTGRKAFKVERNRNTNVFTITQGFEKRKEQLVPFVTNGIMSALELIKDTIFKEIYYIPTQNERRVAKQQLQTIYSQPTDSLLKRMMHRSDNFFAEQTLLLVADEISGWLESKIAIDSLLKTDLRDLPQRPGWVDGSGLSRYNLFTPHTLVVILNNMKEQFGLERLKVIFPTGGKGTLENHYIKDSGYIFAKTGTLTGVVALSGYMITKKGRLLVFSVLVNNHRASAVTIRNKIENFLTTIRKNY